MSIDKNPDCPFVKRFSEDLLLNGKSPRTVHSYARALRKFIEYLGQAPDQASEDHLRNYRALMIAAHQLRCLGFAPQAISHLEPSIDQTPALDSS